MSSARAAVIAAVRTDQPAVVDHAVREAGRLGAPLRVVHCVERDGPGGRADGTVVLECARAAARRAGAGTQVEYVLEHGDPAAALLAHADDASALVVGTHGDAWFDRMLGGVVSGVLVLGSACPVSIVPEGRAAGRGRGIVVTLDGDTSSSGPLRYGFEQAADRGEELHVLHATPPGTTPEDAVVLADRVRRDVARWGYGQPGVSARLSPTRARGLDEGVAATARASLLVIGRPHGSGHLFALARPLALRVLREARCVVAVVPARYGAAPERWPTAPEVPPTTDLWT